MEKSIFKNSSILVKCKEQTIEFTKKFKLRGNAPKINKLKANLTRVIDEGGNSEEILDIESQIRELGPHWRKVRRLD